MSAPSTAAATVCELCFRVFKLLISFYQGGISSSRGVLGFLFCITFLLIFYSTNENTTPRKIVQISISDPRNETTAPAVVIRLGPFFLTFKAQVVVKTPER